MHGVVRLLGASLALIAAPAATASAADPTWWAPNAALHAPRAHAGGGPPDADFDHVLTGWRLLGPGAVSVRAGGPTGHYAAMRDNTTLVSTPWMVPATAQVLTLAARGVTAHEQLRVLAEPATGHAATLLGIVSPGKSWATASVNARPVAGRRVRLVLDPVMGFHTGIDLTRVGATVQVAPRFDLVAGAVGFVPLGPSGSGGMLVAASDALTLRGTGFRLAGDADSMSVWARALTGTQPSLSVLVNDRVVDGGAVTPGAWTPLRFAVAPLRGRLVRVDVQSTAARGLELSLVGTVQRAPRLVLGRPRRVAPKRVKLHVAASPLLAGQALDLELRQPAGWRVLRSLTLARDGTATLTMSLRAMPIEVRVRYRGSEPVGPGLSLARRLPRAGVKHGP